MAAFKKGDIVQLKSGGPKMTYTGNRGGLGIPDDYLQCQWFAGNKLEQGQFPPESLVLIEESESKKK